MGTVIRPDISRKNKYWIDKHRHYELKHFCLQYPEWKKAYNAKPVIPSSVEWHNDPTAKEAMQKTLYSKMEEK